MAVVLLIVSVLRLPESSDASGIPAVPASLLGVLQFATALVALFVGLVNRRRGRRSGTGR